jgi:cell division septum initiation protein DivIVA
MAERVSRTLFSRSVTAPFSPRTNGTSSANGVNGALKPGAPPREEPFPSALRGYDRRQVDSKIAALESDLATAARERKHAVDRLSAESERADQAESKLTEALARIDELDRSAAGDQTGGFGQRAERLLRMAENEATEARAAAAKEAAAILEDARGEAETHRHAVEQELITKAAQQDQEASRRAGALQEREQEIANERTAARQETDEMRESARREVERMLQDAEAKAADVRRQADKFAEQQRDGAAREVERLTGMRHGVRAELSRLHQYLGTELSEDGDRSAE